MFYTKERGGKIWIKKDEQRLKSFLTSVGVWMRMCCEWEIVATVFGFLSENTKATQTISRSYIYKPAF